MHRKIFFLLSIIIVVFAFHACNWTLPTALKIKTGNLSLEIPTKIGTINVTNLLHSFLSETFEKNGVELYDMKNYPGAQAFVLGYTIDLMPDLDPETYVTMIKEQMGIIDDLDPGGLEPIYPAPIVIPSVSFSEPDQIHDTGIQDYFDDMQKKINNTSMTPLIPIPMAVPKVHGSLPSALFDEITEKMDNIVAWDGLKNANFDKAYVKQGKISLLMELVPNGETTKSGMAGLVINFNGFKLIEDNRPPEVYNPIGSPASPQNISLDASNNFKAELEYILDKAVLDKDHSPIFNIDSITAAYNGATVLGEYMTFSLVIKPEITEISLQGAEKLRIGEMSPDLPKEVKDVINDGFDLSEIDGLLNIEIGKGMLKVKASMPEKTTEEKTYCEGLDTEFILCIKQEDYEYDGSKFKGLRGDPWSIKIIDGFGELDLKGIIINRNDLTIVQKKDAEPGEPYSQIKAKSDSKDGISFMLYGKDLDELTIPITIALDVEIEEIKNISWALENTSGISLIPKIDDIEIDFETIGEAGLGAGNGDISKFVESITFEYINLGIDFTVPNPAPAPNNPGDPQLIAGDSGLPLPLRNKLAISIDCLDLGFNNTKKILGDGLNNIHSEPPPLFLKDTHGKAKTLKVKAGVVPVINGIVNPDAKYIQIGPVQLNKDDETLLNLYGEVKFDFKWKEIKVNLEEAIKIAGAEGLGALKGQFPQGKDGEPAKPIDIYGYVNKYMRGFKPGDIELKLFLGGPKDLIDLLSPKLDVGLSYQKRINLQDPNDSLAANWADVKTSLFKGNLNIYSTSQVPKLPGKNPGGEYVYTQPNLSGLGTGISISNINTVIGDLPKDMLLNYEMILPTEFIITPTIFDNVDTSDKGIKAFMVAMVPLEFKGEAGAYFAFPESMFGDKPGTDLFGRTSTDGITPDGTSVFTDVDVKSLGLEIFFESALFTNGTLHIDKNKKLFPNGLNLGSGNSLGISISGKDFDIIKNNMIYPDVRIEFNKGTTLKIPKNPMPLKIKISANGSYTFDLPSGTVP